MKAQARKQKNKLKYCTTDKDTLCLFALLFAMKKSVTSPVGAATALFVVNLEVMLLTCKNRDVLFSMFAIFMRVFSGKRTDQIHKSCGILTILWKSCLQKAQGKVVFLETLKYMRVDGTNKSCTASLCPLLYCFAMLLSLLQSNLGCTTLPHPFVTHSFTQMMQTVPGGTELVSLGINPCTAEIMVGCTKRGTTYLDLFHFLILQVVSRYNPARLCPLASILKHIIPYSTSLPSRKSFQQ